MQTWQIVWRKGIAPQLSVGQLEALATALRTNDPRLIQGATTAPTPLQCTMDWACEGACVMAFPGLVENVIREMPTVNDVQDYFVDACSHADDALGEPGGCRWFVNWFDDTPRAECFALLLAEVERTLAERRPVGVA